MKNEQKKIIIIGMPQSGKTSLILAFERSILQKSPHHFEKFGQRVMTTAQDFNAIQPTTSPGIYRYSLQLQKSSHRSEFGIYEFLNPDPITPFVGRLDEFLIVFKECSDILLTIEHPESKDITNNAEEIQKYYRRLLTYLDELSRAHSSPPILRLIFTKGEQMHGIAPKDILPVLGARFPELQDFLSTAFPSINIRQVFTVGWDDLDQVNYDYANQNIKETVFWNPQQVFELFNELLSLEGKE